MQNNKKIINAWCMYDWANSAFATSVMAAFAPLFFSTIGTRLPDGSTHTFGVSLWGYTSSAAMLFVAVLSLVFGPNADSNPSKKRYLTFFMILGAASSAALGLTGQGGWLWIAVFFIIGNVGFAVSEVFYDSLLPHIAPVSQMDRVSTRAYALGYAGGGTLLALNILMVMLLPESTLSGTAETAPAAGMRLSFVSVGIWWFIFTIPLLRHVPEPPVIPALKTDKNIIASSARRLRGTFRQIKNYPDLCLFIIAFWFYNDGIGTIMKMAVVFGNDVGIGALDLVGALMLTQIIGVPCSFAFSNLANKISTKKAILSGIFVYALISASAYFMSTALHFWLLAGCVGLVQGGTQALSRSLYASMVPKAKSAEFFSFYAISGKFAGVFGPAVFGLAGQLAASSRFGVLSLVFFFAAGGVLLLKVNVERGRQNAINQTI